MFEPYSRGGSGNYRQGLGPGLYIASQIAAAHGGTLEATSDGVETCFTFRMPCDDKSASETDTVKRAGRA